MSAKKKKSREAIGTVLRTIKGEAALRPWADYMATNDLWKTVGITAESLLARWLASDGAWRFFSGADPKNAKVQGFDHEHGFIVFNETGARSIIAEHFKTHLPSELEDGGFVQAIATKVRKKGVGKYLLSAAERVISERSGRVYLFVSESNAHAQRFYKSAGYEEVLRASDVFCPGNTEILFTKSLK